ncbi:FecCD family ABC transporter permease [Glutamicibacter sp. NPDC087344]|uniref:FecCD family ABC transporter permease n=1 Tax=Glutamicibacter sp. NPDC087344 TaxID=3363994 RepID=UPI00381BDA8F
MDQGLLTGERVLRVGTRSVRLHRRILLLGTALAGLLLALIAASLMFGGIRMDFGALLEVFAGRGSDSAQRSVLGRRLPRVLTAAGVGMLLGASGALFQSLTRNPLGSPDVIGLTSGAAAGAVAQIVLFGGGVLPTALAAVAGGVFSALLVYLLSLRDAVTGGLRLILVGIGVGALATAATSLILLRANTQDATLATLWTAGSLTGRGWPHAVAVGVAVLALLPLLSVMGRGATLGEMGDDTALALGLPIERLRMLSVLLAVTAAAAATAATGPIAFIAFASPQIIRRLAPRPETQIWLSALGGAVLLCAADLLAQSLSLPVRTPVGLVTSVLGGLYLLWLLARRI